MRAEREAANITGELRAQASWRERLVRALDPRPLLGDERVEAATDRPREPVGVG